MSKKMTLTLAVHVTAEEHEDRWAFYVHEFGFTVYGNSEEEGHERVAEAVTALLKSFDYASFKHSMVE